ncbi:MAG: hypothetical protein ACE3L7_07340 [Candidatus Pristimantibacillus sp.]
MSKSHSTAIKSVSFTLDDPDERLTFEHAMKRTNFSAYVRGLIELDRLGGKLAVLTNKIETLPAQSSDEAISHNYDLVEPSVVENSALGFL